MLTPSTSIDKVRPSRASRLLGGLLPGQLREYSRGVAPLLLALSLLNASNYLFHVAVSRLLGPTAYGALTALLALMLLLSVPFGVLQATVAKRASVLRTVGSGADVVSLAAGAVKLVVPIAGAVVVGSVVAGPLVAAFLHVGVLSAVLVGVYIAVSLVLSVPLGSLQGMLRFRALATVTFAGVLVRFAIGVGLVRIGLGVPGALLGSVLAQALALVLAWRVLGLSFASWRHAHPTLDLLRDGFVVTLLGLSAFWMLAEGDVVLARHYLGTASAGFYSSAEILARALLFLPGAISIVALPRFTELRGRGEELRRLLRTALIAVNSLVWVSLVVLTLARRQAVGLAFGHAFAPAAALVAPLAIGTGLMASALLLVYFHIAVGTRAHAFLFAGFVLQSVLIAIFHGSPMQVAMCVVVATAITTAGLYHAAVAACRWPRAASDKAVAVAPAELRLSVVLPCHNAGRGLADVLSGLRQELRQVEGYEIIVVSDGSTDDTVDVARSFRGADVRVITYPDRSGKGHALRTGLAEARGEYVAFMDSDGDISPSAIRPFLAIVDLYDPDVILGSKRHPLSEVEYPPLRRALSWTYHKITRVMFRVNVRDTQTGMKMIRRDVLAATLPRMLEKRYAFDLEFLVVAKRLGFTRVFEAPVRIDYRFDSQVNPRSAAGILLDTLAVFYRRYILNTYGPKVRRLTESGAIAVSIGEDEDEVSVAVTPLIRPDEALKILVINWRDITNPEAGGAEVYTHEVARRWVAWGHEVTLLTSRFRGARSSDTIDGVRVRRMGALRNGTFHLLVQRELARLQGFDVVIDEINTLPFLTPLWRGGLPPVVGLIHQTARDVWDAEMPAAVAAIGRAVEPRLLGLYGDVPVVTVSESSARDLRHFGLRDVHVVRQGRDDPPDLLGIGKEGVPTFLFVGRLARNKRPDHALAAFASIREQLPQARLWIVGQGPMEEELRKTLPTGAELLGYVSRGELYERMARAHCLLVPSVREGWGMVITEANGVGTPAVGYEVAGILDAIHDGRTGYLAAPGEPDSLAEFAVRVVADPVAYARMRTEAATWAKEFRWDSTARDFLALIEERVGRVVSVEREEAPRETLVSVG